MRQLFVLSMLSLLFVPAAADGQTADEMKAFPPATAGTVRCVLQLPPLADESLHKVELMAVDPKAPKVARFIPLGGEPYIIRYNSKLPIVIYLPEGAEVRYRIWTAADEIKAISEG